MAPANASAPPASHAARNHQGSGIAAATCGGVKRMPPPMTLATTIAAASQGPSRRSSVAACVGEVTRGLLRDDPALDREFADLRPLRGSRLGEDPGLDV